MDFWKVVDGKIVDNWVNVDFAHVAAQLGVDLFNGQAGRPMIAARKPPHVQIRKVSKMSVQYLHKSKPESEKAAEDARVRAVVEATLGDIEARGDAAVRELSEKFDNYSPTSFRLSDSEIQAAMQRVSARDMEDIIAQKQIRPPRLSAHHDRCRG